jgi:hypothetical protein
LPVAYSSADGFTKIKNRYITHSLLGLATTKSQGTAKTINNLSPNMQQT